MPKEIIIAIISGSVAVGTSVISFLYTYFALDRQRQKYNEQLEKIKGDIADKNKERDARRDYEYEARKKLYEEYEPLFFRFAEKSEAAHFRIKSLANRAADGRLGENGWLMHDGYYMQSTIYFLMAPLASFKLLRGKLTYVDLRVDKGIYSTYILGKVLFASFSDAFSIADKTGIPYNPFEGAGNVRQDIPIGVTENIAELLLTPDPANQGALQVGNLARFQTIFTENNSNDLTFFKDRIRIFHPNRLPVLWRVLVVQAIIYKVINRLRREVTVTTKEMLIKEVTDAANSITLHDLDWRTSAERTVIADTEISNMLPGIIDYLKQAIEGYY